MQAHTQAQMQMKVAGGFPGFMHEHIAFASGHHQHYPKIVHSEREGV